MTPSCIARRPLIGVIPVEQRCAGVWLTGTCHGPVESLPTSTNACRVQLPGITHGSGMLTSVPSPTSNGPFLDLLSPAAAYLTRALAYVFNAQSLFLTSCFLSSSLMLCVHHHLVLNRYSDSSYLDSNSMTVYPAVFNRQGIRGVMQRMPGGIAIPRRLFANGIPSRISGI